MDLDIARVIKSIPKEHEKEELAPLMTSWGEELAANLETVPFPEHPRPQFARKRVWILNGWWQYAFVACPEASSRWRDERPPQDMEGLIRVPFSPEAALSGVGRQLQPDELLWYRCNLTVPELGHDDRCLLHFDGVDHACALYLNGAQVAVHEGAYQPFSVDVTDYLNMGDTMLELCVYDPSDTGTQLRGKQRLERGGMWYTAQSGIWQTVWMEVVPATHVEDLRIVADPDHGELLLTAWLEGHARLTVDVLDDARTVVAHGASEPAKGVGVVTVSVRMPDAHRWSPDDPYLYRLRITYGSDRVMSYCAFRTVSVELCEDGASRLCLNHEPLFCRGLLDQGYWPDGLMTAPSEAAMVADLQLVKDLGFNMVRKHIKVEPERWYWLCDRLGILVWQDMPSGGANPADWPARNIPTLFKGSWHAQPDDDGPSWKRLGAGDEAYRDMWTQNMCNTVSRLSNHPCIMLWVLFNESWGQFDSSLATQRCWELDPTRPVLSASGWYDQGTGDVHGVHNYFRGMHMFDDPFAGKKDRRRVHRGRAQVISEFGGLVWHEDEHSSLPHSYGYAEFESKEAWLGGVKELLASAEALEGQGLSGFVYTQLSDVEEETNGLVTYDRKVRKLS